MLSAIKQSTNGCAWIVALPEDRFSLQEDRTVRAVPEGKTLLPKCEFKVQVPFIVLEMKKRRFKYADEITRKIRNRMQSEMNAAMAGMVEKTKFVGDFFVYTYSESIDTLDGFVEAKNTVSIALSDPDVFSPPSDAILEKIRDNGVLKEVHDLMDIYSVMTS